MELIQTYTVTAEENNIVIGNIPNTFRHLLYQQILKTPVTNVSVYHNLILNNDSGANYGRQQMYGYGSATNQLINTRPLSADSLINGCGIDHNHFAFMETVIFDYKGSTFKNILSKGGGSGVAGTTASNNSSQNFYFANIWQNTSAVTSIKNVATSGNYAVGTTFILWGLE